jgi:hypothetical protein
MRALGLLFVSLTSLASLACARSSTAESTTTAEHDDAEPPTQPAEVEGPAPTSESATAAGEAGLCALGPVAEWSACDGQRVHLRGRAAEQVMQHPVVAVPIDVSPDGSNSHQGYMDAEGVQLIVLTKTPFDCRGAISVVGTLRGLDLGGDADTRGKNSYSGWMVENAEVTCE